MGQILYVLHFKHRSTTLVTAVPYFRASNRLEHSDFRSRFLCFQTANQKKCENPMSSEPFDSRAKALPAKRSEKGYGIENGVTQQVPFPRVIASYSLSCNGPFYTVFVSMKL